MIKRQQKNKIDIKLSQTILNFVKLLKKIEMVLNDCHEGASIQIRY